MLERNSQVLKEELTTEKFYFSLHFNENKLTYMSMNCINRLYILPKEVNLQLSIFRLYL